MFCVNRFKSADEVAVWLVLIMDAKVFLMTFEKFFLAYNKICDIIGI